MRIPQGLIVYRAPRHQEYYPMNLKHRYYTNKIVLSTEMQNPNRSRANQQRYQKQITKMVKMSKMTQRLTLSLEKNDLGKTYFMHTLSKLHRLKKCELHFSQEAQSISKQFTLEIVKRIFKTLKYLEHVEMNQLGQLQKDPRIFQNLSRQKSLQKLVINPLYYYAKNLKAFMRLVKKASRKKSWPRFKSLRLHILAAEKRETHTGPPGSMKKLFNFLNNFKSWYGLLYKCLQFHLISSREVGSTSIINDADAFFDVLKLKPPLTHISVYQFSHIASLLRIPQYLRHLQSIHVQLYDELSYKLQTNSFKEFANLREMSLVVDCTCEPYGESFEAYFYYDVLKKLQDLTNLRSLSLYIYGDPEYITDIFCATLSRLSELTYLKLLIHSFKGQKELEWSWLKKGFQSIVRMKKLKELYLGFETFGSEQGLK